MAPSVMAGQLGARVGFYEAAEVRAHHSSSDHSANPLVWTRPWTAGKQGVQPPADQSRILQFSSSD